jgi:DNA polymerase-3 subunit gamma/tau
MAKRKPAPEPAPAEGYTVLARRYRPQGFADLVGQEPVAQALTNALASGRVAHAYLFTGARGVGKTSTARILAKCLNCVKGPTATPCNECENCRAIATGDDVDVLEIDGASNNGVDEVRELRGNVQYRPSRSRFKIYVIDEVHMLSKAAFNALLKTLEEPPPHVKFIFATTEVEKIPITILSRCQRFDFAGIGTPRIVQRLREIVAGEGMQADDEALELIARRAGGSMRDAQSLLDQLLAFGGERLTVDQVHHLLGTASDDRVAELAAAALQGDPRRALELLGKAADDGLQLGELLDQLTGWWRDLMLVNGAGPDAPGLNVTSKHRPTLVEQAGKLSLDTILAGLDILSATKARMRTSSHGRVLFEMALVRLGRLEDLVALSQLAQTMAGQPAADLSKKKPSTAANAPLVASAPGWSASVPGAVMALTAESLPSIWSRVLAQLSQLARFPLEKAPLPAISGPNSLVMRFPSEYNVARDRSQDPQTVGRIEQLLQQITGQAWRFKVETGEPAGPPAPPGKSDPQNLPARSSPCNDEAADPPLVKGVKDLLGAKVLKQDPGFGVFVPASGERAEPADAEEP